MYLSYKQYYAWREEWASKFIRLSRVTIYICGKWIIYMAAMLDPGESVAWLHV